MQANYAIKKMSFGSFISEYITIPFNGQYIHVWSERTIKTLKDNGYNEYSFSITDDDDMLYRHTVDPIQTYTDIDGMMAIILKQFTGHLSIRIYNPQLIMKMPKILRVNKYELLEFQESTQFNKHFARFCINRNI